jgi:hypothetical protein
LDPSKKGEEKEEEEEEEEERKEKKMPSRLQAPPALAPYRLLPEDFVREMFIPQLANMSASRNHTCGPPGSPPSFQRADAQTCQQYSILSYIATNNTPPPPSQPSCDYATDGMVKVIGAPNGRSTRSTKSAWIWQMHTVQYQYNTVLY